MELLSSDCDLPWSHTEPCPSASQARAILSVDYAGRSPWDVLAAQVRHDPLVSLFDCVNGAWGWSTPLGPHATAYSAFGE